MGDLSEIYAKHNSDMQELLFALGYGSSKGEEMPSTEVVAELKAILDHFLENQKTAKEAAAFVEKTGKINALMKMAGLEVKSDYLNPGPERIHFTTLVDSRIEALMQEYESHKIVEDQIPLKLFRDLKTFVKEEMSDDSALADTPDGSQRLGGFTYTPPPHWA